MIYMLTLGMIALLLIGIPVGFGLGATALFSTLIGGQGTFYATIISQKTLFGLQNFLLVAIPLFILAAKLMNTAGITTKLFRFANTLVGFMPGGLGHANIIASLIFAGMSGAAVADAAGLGQIELKAMKDAGYDDEFSVAVTSASSTIGPIFPPSIPMVVFAFASGASVGRLFLGGVVPAMLMCGTMMIMVAIYAKKRGYPREKFPTFAIAMKSVAEAFLPLMTPVILLGGIWSGFFTATEAAGVAVVYALVLGVIVYKELTLKDVVRVFKETARESAVIGIVVAMSAFYGWILMRSGFTSKIAGGILSISNDPTVILILINLILLVIGCFLDSTVAILIVGPILMQVILPVGIDPVHFGVVMVLNLMIGLLTPPFGIVLFVMAQVSGLKFWRVVKATAPFYIPLMIVLLLITFMPGLVTWLPSYVMGIAK